MLTHRLRKTRQPDHPAHLSLNDVLHLVKPPEKWSDKVVKRLPGGRQPERPSFEEPRAEVFLESRHLRAHRGLLDPVGNLPAGGHDAFASSDVIEQLQMVHIQHIDRIDI